ncbi:MAG: SagB/ThcOx family dehydrogenase [Armatimonadetes bacterium]|nr:SagB/ThcOx family dehydrogenase [Armatimonadota bacterium]
MSPNESLGDAYHRATKYARPGGSAVQPVAIARPGRHIDLPPPVTENGAGLWQAIRTRRSLRDFDPSRPMTPAELSQLFWATQGLTFHPSDDRFRASPSAGALHPLDTYLVINRVSGIPSGIAQYDVRAAGLNLLAEGDFSQEVAAAALEQEMAADCGVVFIWVAVPARCKPKYRDRGHRYIYLDAGYLGAQLHLAAVALGLGCCAIGAFLDDEVNALVGVDGETETAVYLSVVGHVR